MLYSCRDVLVFFDAAVSAYAQPTRGLPESIKCVGLGFHANKMALLSDRV